MIRYRIVKRRGFRSVDYLPWMPMPCATSRDALDYLRANDYRATELGLGKFFRVVAPLGGAPVEIEFEEAVS